MSEKNLSQAIRERMRAGNKRFWAGDNVSDYITPWDKEMLINEATGAFEQVLDTFFPIV